jgi:PLP dependent protein
MSEFGDATVQRLAGVRKDIIQAATDCQRDAADITLVAVAKTFDAADIWPVIVAGQRVFGENRVQEAKAKWPALRAKASRLDAGSIELHLIGPLQSNKVGDAVTLFDVIETLDRPKIAAALASEMVKRHTYPRLFVQINTGAEPQKAGVLPEQADTFIDWCRQSLKLSINGLMCIPPIGTQVSPHFALLAQIAKRHAIKNLSMGMSADFSLAIQLGATHVRVGSAIFGIRPPHQEGR